MSADTTAQPAGVATPDAAADKTFKTWQAAAALRGVIVQRIDGDTGAEFIVSMKGGAYVARRFSLDALGGLLVRMGVRL